MCASHSAQYHRPPELAQPFAVRELVARFPNVPVARLRRQLGLLREEGRIRRIGMGRGA
jgi:hypothetical protein